MPIRSNIIFMLGRPCNIHVVNLLALSDFIEIGWYSNTSEKSGQFKHWLQIIGYILFHEPINIATDVKDRYYAKANTVNKSTYHYC